MERSILDHVTHHPAVRVALQPPGEPIVLRRPEMIAESPPHRAGALRIGVRPLRIAEQPRKLRGRLQGGDHSADGVGMNAAPLLPEIPRRQRQAGRGITEVEEKIGAGTGEGAVHRLHELEVAVLLVVVPQSPDRQRGLVFLDGSFRRAVGGEPGVPGRAHGAVGAVLVHQGGAVTWQHVPAELEEAARDRCVPGGVERMGDQRAVARPHVGVVGAVGVHDIRVVGRQDSPPGYRSVSG